MIPQTFGALLGFVGFVAPGLVYNTIAERRRSPRSESAFAEISRVALTSLGFSLIGLAILWLLQQHPGLALPNIGLWLMHGNKYAANNLGKVIFGLIAQVALACGLAAAVAWILTRKDRSRFRSDTVYGSIFRRWAPEKFGNWVYAKLEDGTEFWGYERAHYDRGEAAGRIIVLQGEALMRKLPDESDWQPIGKNWDIVVLDVARILYMQVIYQNDDGELRGKVTSKYPKGEPRNIGIQPTDLYSSVSSPPSVASDLNDSNSPAETTTTEPGLGDPSDRQLMNPSG